MKKSVVIIFAIAIIGALGAAAKAHHNNGAPLSAPGAAVTKTEAPNNGDSSGQSSVAKTYKDGKYNGESEDTPYGTVQIAVVVSSGKITDVKFLQMPNDRGHTQEVTAFAEPYLKDETIQKQSADIQFVSGATTTSEAYQQSLQAALDQAA